MDRRVPKTGRVTMTITNSPGGGLRADEWDTSTRVHYKDYIENMDISYLDKEDEIRVQRLRKKLDRCKKALEEMPIVTIINNWNIKFVMI